MTADEAYERLKAGWHVDYDDLEPAPQDSGQRRRYLVSERERLNSLLWCHRNANCAYLKSFKVSQQIFPMCAQSDEVSPFLLWVTFYVNQAKALLPVVTGVAQRLAYATRTGVAEQKLFLNILVRTTLLLSDIQKNKHVMNVRTFVVLRPQ